MFIIWLMFWTTAVPEVSHQNTLAFVFMIVHWSSARIWETAFLDIFLIQNHSSCFPEVISNHLTVVCSQERAQETEHIAKHQRACDAPAQEWELSLRGILLGSGLGPGNRVISLTKAVTGNQDSLPEDDCLNCKSAEAWSHLYFLRVIPYKTMWSFL